MMRTVLVAGLLVALLGCEKPQEPFQVLEFTPPAGGLVVGRADVAPVLVEFGSHTCPACRQLVDSVWPALREQFIEPGRIQYRYVEAGPAQADPLSALVECESLNVDVLRARARLNFLIEHAKDSLPILLERGECVKSPERIGRRKSERSLAESMRIRGTPTLIIGRQHADGRIVGWAVIGVLSRDSILTLMDRAAEGDEN